MLHCTVISWWKISVKGMTDNTKESERYASARKETRNDKLAKLERRRQPLKKPDTHQKVINNERNVISNEGINIPLETRQGPDSWKMR